MKGVSHSDKPAVAQCCHTERFNIFQPAVLVFTAHNFTVLVLSHSHQLYFSLQQDTVR